MATLPDVAGSSRSPGPRPSMGVAAYEPSQVGGIAAQAMRQGGAEFQQASDIIAQTNARQDELISQSKINALDQDAMMMEFDTSKGFRSAKEGAAVGETFLETYQAQFDGSRKRMRESLSPTQQRIFDRHADVRATRFKAGLLSHQAQETERFNDTTTNAQITNGLQRIAVDPSNEWTFQSGLEEIKRTVAETGIRKGWGKEQIDSVGAKFHDAAYTTRITSILNGIPGLQPADPYEATKMFGQVQSSLSPQAQTHLAREIDRGLELIQASDMADKVIGGTAPMRPREVLPVITGAPLAGSIVPVIRELETGGLRDPEGAVSVKGAKGPMQVMPGTSLDPGFGVRPAQLDRDRKPLPGELARVGVEYAGAMVARYDHPALVLAAYNAGPGTVDDWLAGTNKTGKNPQKIRLSDPRSADVNSLEWAAVIPFEETKKYVANGLNKLASTGSPPTDVPLASPTPEQLQVDLIDRAEFARQWAREVRPNNPAFADAVAARVMARGNQVIQGKIAQQRMAHDTLWQAAIGSKPDGSDRPASIDQMLSSTQARQAWGQTDVMTKKAVQDFFAHGASDKWTPDSERLYHQLLGRAMDDPEGFSSSKLTDLSQFIGRMPREALTNLLHRQAALNTREQKEADANMALRTMLSEAEVQLAAVGLGAAKAKGSESVRERREVFLGQLTKSVDAWRAENGGKRPHGKELQGIVSTLLQPGTVPGSLFGLNFGRNEARAFEGAGKPGFAMPPPENPAVFEAFRADLEKRVGGGKLSDTELQRAWTMHKLAGRKDPAPLPPPPPPTPPRPGVPRRRVEGVVTEE